MRVSLKALLASVILVSAIAVSSGNVTAQQSASSISARIAGLERQVQQLQRRLGGNAGTTNPTATGGNAILADLSARMGTLERQIRQLNGRLEEQDYRQQEMSEQIEQLQAQMLLARQQQLETQNNPPVETPTDNGAEVPQQTTATPAVQQPEQPAVALPEGDATLQYNYAFSFVRRNDLASAKTAMEQFLAANADSGSAANAKFWLGRINLQQGNPAEAARFYLALIEEHPNHNRRPDALVDLADALVQIDASDDACNALQEFRRIEGDASTRARDSARRVDQAASCGLF